MKRRNPTIKPYPLCENKSDLFGRVYISGAITGLDIQEREGVFEEVEGWIKTFGLDCFNPFKNGYSQDSSVTREQHIKIDLVNLLECDTILFLPGWENSRGCLLEMNIAEQIGMPIFIYYE